MFPKVQQIWVEYMDENESESAAKRSIEPVAVAVVAVVAVVVVVDQ